jgi:hypothetical protein
MSTIFSGYANIAGTQNLQDGGVDGAIDEEIKDDSKLDNPLVYISWTMFSFFFVVGLIVTYNYCRSARRVGAGHDDQVVEDTQDEDQKDTMTRSERCKWYDEKLKGNNTLVQLSDDDFKTFQVYDNDDDDDDDDDTFVASESGDGSENVGDLEAGMESSKRRRRRCLEITVSCGTTRRIFGGCCAICLNNYQPGETITISACSECAHVFHQGCLVDTFAHTKGTKTNPCPICRREFIHPPLSVSRSSQNFSTEEVK